MQSDRQNLAGALAYAGFRQIQPSARLEPYVQCYWQIRSNLASSCPSIELLHPDGGLGMILNFGHPLIYEEKEICVSGFMDGIHTRTRRLTMAGHVDAIGIRFKPGGAALFFSVPIAEIGNLNLDLNELALEQFLELCQEYNEANPDGNILNFVDGALQKLLTEPRSSELLVQAVMNRIESTGGVAPISNVIEDIGRSCRQVERLFKGYVGMTPKQYARIVRVKNARQRLKNRSTQSCTEIGLLSGFYDQAHFIREFQSIIGLSPMEYLHFRRQRPGEEQSPEIH